MSDGELFDESEILAARVRSDARLHVALAGAPVMLASQDLTLRYTWAYGARAPFPREVVGRTDEELLGARAAAPLVALKRKALACGSTSRDVVRAGAGGASRLLDVSAEPLCAADGSITGVSTAAWDVTEQRIVDEERRAASELALLLGEAALDLEEVLRTLAAALVEELGDLCIVHLLDGDRVARVHVAHADPEAAPHAQRLESLPIEPRRPRQIFAALERRASLLVEDATADAIAALAQCDEQAALLRALDVRSYIVMPLVARGRLHGACSILATRSPRRHGTHHLRIVERMAPIAGLAVDNAHHYRAARQAIEARDEVLRVVAHDLRSPLHSMLLQSDLLGLLGEWSDLGRKALHGIRRAGHRMNRLIEDLLDVTRIESGALVVRPSVVELAPLIDEVVEELTQAADAGSVTLSCDLAPALPEVLGDRDRLVQLLINAVGNAIKFTPPGGQVCVEAFPAGERVRLSVVDTGIGFSPAQLPHAFERFWRGSKTDRRGAGLGLTIVKAIVEAHGGRVWIESRIGEGTRITCELPAVPRTDAAAQPSFAE